MTPSTDLNIPLFERAKALIPGGVNSPVRAFKAVGGTPRFVKRAQGAYFWDANDQRFIDYIGSWGPMILGHGHPAVLEAVQKAALEGFSFGAPTEREVELAEEIIGLVPSMEMIRLVSSGTEAGMSAIRLEVIQPYYFDNIINERDTLELDISWKNKKYDEYVDTLGLMIITDFPKKQIKLSEKITYFRKSNLKYLQNLSVECENWTYEKYKERNQNLIDKLVNFFEV